MDEEIEQMGFFALVIVGGFAFVVLMITCILWLGVGA